MDQISAACWESAKEALSSNSCRKHFHFFRDQLLLNHFLKSWYIANWTHTHTHLPVTRWRSIIADELICSCTCGGQADIVLYCSVCFCFELGSLPIGVAQWASRICLPLPFQPWDYKCSLYNLGVGDMNSGSYTYTTIHFCILNHLFQLCSRTLQLLYNSEFHREEWGQLSTFWGKKWRDLS